MGRGVLATDVVDVVRGGEPYPQLPPELDEAALHRILAREAMVLDFEEEAVVIEYGGEPDGRPLRVLHPPL